MKYKNKYYSGLVLLILIGAGLFYWYQVRPYFAYKKCHELATQNLSKETSLLVKAIQKKLGFEDAYESIYRDCLRERGINQ